MTPPTPVRAALEAVVATARYGFRGTVYRNALDAARRVLGYHCSECGAVYVSNEAHDHKTKQCRGEWLAREAAAQLVSLSDATHLAQVGEQENQP